MPTSVTTLHTEFTKQFNISKVHWQRDGGQKQVYLITRNGKKCILKIYKNFNKRDIRELDIYKKFKNISNIPKVIEVNKYEKDTISFEEYIEGNCLDTIADHYINQEKKVRELLIGVCNVMLPLWNSKEQIVHRDIKPSNLIIKPDGKPVVIDFGIAKDTLATTVTSTGFQPNSWQFAAPEQYEGKNDLIHYRTDFFSIGSLGYYLYHGNLAFGNTKDKISGNFQDKGYKIAYLKSCKLIPFFTETLNIPIPGRPRSPEEMIKLLTS